MKKKKTNPKVLASAKKPNINNATEEIRTTRNRPILLSLVFLFSFLNIVFVVIVIILLILIRFTSTNAFPQGKASNVTFSYFLKRPDLLASAKALVVYDATAKVPLLSKNQNLRFSPASTAKVMSALVALEYYKPETILLVQNLSKDPDISRMGLFLGEKISVLHLVYGMLLPSGGDAAEVLAANYPGGEKAFVRQMNDKARSLGLLNTFFVDPSGYGDDNYSTASDLAQLGAYALKNSTIRDIVKTKKIIVYDEEKKIPHVLVNLNELLEIKNVTGIKTGFTNEAEGVLVTSFVHRGKTYIIVVLGSRDRFTDTRLFIEGIINDLTSESVAS